MKMEELVGLAPAAVLGRWLDVSLMESLQLSEELSEEERAFRLEAARLAVKEMAPDGAGIEEKMQAVAYVCAHGAGLDYLAQANSRFLAPEVRAGAQRMACRVLALASRQATVLARLRAARAKALEAAALKARGAKDARRWEAEERAQAEGGRTLRNEADPAALKAAGLTRDDLDAFREVAGGLIPPEPLTPDQRRAALERLRKLARDGP